MKNALAYPLIILLLLLSTGLRLQVHFMEDQLYDASLFGEPESCCDIQCGCCTEATYAFKLDADFLTSHQQKLPDMQADTSFFEPYIPVIQHAQACFQKNTCPTGPPTVPYPALLQVFRL